MYSNYTGYMRPKVSETTSSHLKVTMPVVSVWLLRWPYYLLPYLFLQETLSCLPRTIPPVNMLL
jgi:hypothetical protein